MSVHLCWRFAQCGARKYGAPVALYLTIGRHDFMLRRSEFLHFKRDD